MAVASKLEQIRRGIFNLFPDAAGLELTPETQLGKIPEFDSMSAVNLNVFLQSVFVVDVPEGTFGEGTTIAEVAGFINRQQCNVDLSICMAC